MKALERKTNMETKNYLKTKDYLKAIGVRDLPARTIPFDPGYDAHTVAEHLRQSSHLMAGLKISMACWQIANEDVTREKIACCNKYSVKACAGGGPLEVAAAFDQLEAYIDLCADVGLHRIEAGEGIVVHNLQPDRVVGMARDQGLEVQFELGEKHSGSIDDTEVDEFLRTGEAWLNAGAKQLVVEARESAEGVGLFDNNGRLDTRLADRFMEHFGEETIIFEAPTKQSQFALMNNFGPSVFLGNIRLEELLRMEIYRRGLHSDAFLQNNLRPLGTSDDT